MASRFRTMLAPINLSTGDGRRFASESIELAPTPFPFEWARSRESGHGGAVVVGVVEEAAVLSVADAVTQEWISSEVAKNLGLGEAAMAVWGRGQFFDDASREDMPRLAEDVAEAMHLIGSGTLGPSVDLDSFEAVPVFPGSDDPITFEDFERVFEETGEEPKVELLITQGRVRAATLVSVPAFMETSRPLELILDESSEPVALVASVAAIDLPQAAVFDAPKLSGPTPITIDFETGTVFGHIAQWQTCHTGFKDMCVTAPRGAGYEWFNRFPVETQDGVVWAGRLTVGGRHPGLSLTASRAMAVYDDKIVAAHVRASEDEFGIVISGVLSPDLDQNVRSVLSRRKVSGDWRETPEGLSLVEILALSPGPRVHSEPGFPISTYSRAGRQVSLTASFGPTVDPRPAVAPVLDVEALAAVIERRQELRRAREAAVQELEAVLKAGRATDSRADLLADTLESSAGD